MLFVILNSNLEKKPFLYNTIFKALQNYLSLTD